MVRMWSGQIYGLAFVFAAGEGLHDIAMQIRMLAPVAEFEGFGAKAKAILFRGADPGSPA